MYSEFTAVFIIEKIYWKYTDKCLSIGKCLNTFTLRTSPIKMSKVYLCIMTIKDHQDIL